MLATSNGQILATAILAVVTLCSVPERAHAVDWSSCASDLDDVHTQSDDAADAARRVGDAQEDLESKRDDLRSCSYDCEIEKSEYEDAKSEWKDAVDAAQSELSDLDSKVQSASSSCGFDMGTSGGVTSPKSRSNDPCSLLQRYRKRLPLTSLMAVCKESMSESECQKCLKVDTE